MTDRQDMHAWSATTSGGRIGAPCAIAIALAAVLLIGLHIEPKGSLAQWSQSLAHSVWPHVWHCLRSPGRKGRATIVQLVGAVVTFYGLWTAWLRAKHGVTPWGWRSDDGVDSGAGGENPWQAASDDYAEQIKRNRGRCAAADTSSACPAGRVARTLPVSTSARANVLATRSRPEPLTSNVGESPTRPARSVSEYRRAGRLGM